MSVGQKSIHEIVQAVNEQIDISPGVLDSKTMKIVRQALDDLSKRDLTSSMDKIELAALSSKIAALPLVDEKEQYVSKSLISKVIGAFEVAFKSKESLGSLSSAFLSKASLTEEEALQIEAIFLKSPKERDEILLAVSSFIKEGENHTKNKLTIQEAIDILTHIQKIPREERSSICSNTLLFLSKGMEGNEILSLLDSVKRIPQKDREEVCFAAAFLMTKHTGASEITKIFELVQRLPVGQREEVCSSAAHLLKQDLSYPNIRVALSFVVKIAAGERKDVCFAVSAISNQKSALLSATFELFTSVVAIPPKERIQVCKDSSRFIKKNMSQSKIAALLQVMQQIPEKDRALIDFFVKESMDADETILFVKAVRDVLGNKQILSKIKECGEGSPEAFVEILKIAADIGGLIISEHIKSYGITDQGVLIEIAKRAGTECGFGVAFYIKDYGIEAQDARLEIAQIASKKDPEGVIPYLYNFDLDRSADEYKDLVLRCLLLITATGNEFLIGRVKSDIEYYLSKNGDSSVTAEEEIALQKKKTSYFTSCLQVGSKQILPENYWSESDRQAVLDKIALYGNKPIAGSLAVALLDGSHLTRFKEVFLSFAGEKSQGGKVLTSLTAHKILPSIVPTKWISGLKENNSLTAVEEKAALELTSFLHQSKSAFKDNSSRLMQPYLLTAITLDEMEDLSVSKKLQLLSSVCNSSEHIKGFAIIRSLCVRKEIEALENLPLKDPVNELKSAFESALTKDQFINLSGVENLADVYLEKFENTRVPMALETYVTVIRPLGNEEVRKTLERFIRSVLLGTFENERYDTTKTTHLQQIQSYDLKNGTSVLKEWKALTFTDSVSPILESRKEEAFSFEDFFKEKLIDGHGCKDKIEQFSELSSFLAADTKKREEILRVIEEKIVNMQAEPIPHNNDKKKLASILEINLAQKLCMELVVSSDLPKKDQVNKLNEIYLQLPKKVELRSDLKGLAKILETPQKSSSTEKVELCKGWEDLFLAGTEVAGSCQRIDGDASLNKCLLAYCLDGKNAMVAVKGEDGKICARSMLRLLWDKGESKPVLFLDRLYPIPCPEEREESIKMAASECAKKLGLELYTDWKSETLSQGKIIESLGSSCPYEYADGADGVTNGVFTIKDARKIETKTGSQN